MKSYFYPRLRLHISFTDLVFSLFPRKINFSSDSLPILQQFEQGNKQLLVTLSVRTAFDLLLQSLQFPPKTEVLMSAVNIRDMVEIVNQHGLVPVPADITLDTLTPDIQSLERLISPQTRIFLVAHLYGSIINLKPIIDFCQKHQLILVEDCAQAFCGDRYCGDSAADVSLFSFGSIKSCTALGGAIACIKNQTIAAKMAALESEYPRRSEVWFVKRVFKYMGLKLLSFPIVYGKLLGAMKLLQLDLDSTINSLTRGFPPGELIPKIRYRPPQLMVNLLGQRLKNCDHSWFKRREAKARLLISYLSPEIIYPGKQIDFHSFWIFPILTDNPDLLMEKLRENGFDATRGNTSLIYMNEERSRKAERSNYLLTSDQFNQQILYLPVSADLPDREVIRLAQVLNQWSLASSISVNFSQEQMTNDS